MNSFIKKYLRAMLIFSVFIVISGAAKTTVAQQTEDLRTPIVGGYSTAEVTDAEVVSSANFAVKAQAKKQRAKIKLVAVSRA